MVHITGINIMNTVDKMHFEIDFPQCNLNMADGAYTSPETAAYFQVYITAKKRYFTEKKPMTLGDTWDDCEEQK